MRASTHLELVTPPVIENVAERLAFAADHDRKEFLHSAMKVQCCFVWVLHEQLPSSLFVLGEFLGFSTRLASQCHDEIKPPKIIRTESDKPSGQAWGCTVANEHGTGGRSTLIPLIRRRLNSSCRRAWKYGAVPLICFKNVMQVSSISSALATLSKSPAVIPDLACLIATAACEKT